MKFTRIISLVLCAIMFVGCINLPAYAYTESQIQSELDRLEKEQAEIKAEINNLNKDKAKQNQLKSALDKQISNIQSQINLCNDKIDKNNAAIAANELEIAEMNKKIEKAIFEYKKRIRTIHMTSSSGNGVEILLGAETFADFIALSQASLNISRRDKKMVDNIVSVIDDIKEKMKENQAIIEEQKTIKASLAAKQKELDSQADSIQKVINSINADIRDENADKAEIERQIKEWENAMRELNAPPVDNSPFDGKFTWPVPYALNVSSGYGPRWNRNHAGIDIAKSGIANKSVVAAASGTVTVYYSSCTHNHGKVNSKGQVYSCTNSEGKSCGGGYGNYLAIDHGTYNGVSYRTVYAHLAPGSITVKSGQKVGKGQQIGRVGTTGRSTGYHLHFELRVNGSPKNPMDYY